MNFDKFTGPGSTTARRKLWDKVFASVISAQKIEGKNTSVTEYEGQGTLVAFKRDRGTTPVGVCPPPNLCTVDLSFTSDVYTVSQSDLPINPDQCEQLGWNGEWEINCAGDSCGHIIKYCTTSTTCLCGVRLEWIEDVGESDAARVRIILNKIVGDMVLADGWYLWAVTEFPDGMTTCFWETAVCGVFPCTCVFLGADDSIFDTDLLVSVPMIEDPSFPCSGDGTLDLTFHPC